ncbi:hypothetical protein BYT27DRAFT_7206963 [Phlegmacium glaucopus]|nr:hypothetical protein BYT27DRAFT_7206963 [Phlegmacium glaucopus]
MPSKSTQPSKANMGAAEQQEYNTDVVSWAKKLWGAIKDGSYAPDHQDFFDEFNRLCDTSEGSQSMKTTMLDHVALIYDHVASQGYQPDIHYQPLKDAVSNFCTNKPVTKWIGPPNQWSRSPSPTLNSLKPMPMPTNKVGEKTMPSLKPQQLMACIVLSNEGPSKKGKSKAPISEHAQPASDGPSTGKKLAELAHNDDDNAMEIKVPVAKPQKTQRKALTQPSHGQPGQYGAVSIPPNILKKLEDYELATCRQDEKIDKLSQTVACLTQENQTTQEWQDKKFGAAVRAIWEQVPVGLPHEESILKPSTLTLTPTPASPTPQPTTPALLPPLELSTPTADSTPIHMFLMDADVDESPKSNKQSASSITPGQSKHHKLGES